MSRFIRLSAGLLLLPGLLLMGGCMGLPGLGGLGGGYGGGYGGGMAGIPGYGGGGGMAYPVPVPVPVPEYGGSAQGGYAENPGSQGYQGSSQYSYNYPPGYPQHRQHRHHRQDPNARPLPIEPIPDRRQDRQDQKAQSLPIEPIPDRRQDRQDQKAQSLAVKPTPTDRPYHMQDPKALQQTQQGRQQAQYQGRQWPTQANQQAMAGRSPMANGQARMQARMPSAPQMRAPAAMPRAQMAPQVRGNAAQSAVRRARPGM